MSAPRLILRPPRSTDAATIWRDLPEVGGLERNSAYAYLLLCTHFADTGILAEEEGRLAGFVLGYRPPVRPTSMFVWQIGVSRRARGAGLAGRMLDAVLTLPGCAGVRDLCATVSPDNTASLALFRSFARRRQLPCAEAPCFPGRLFPETHPDENLIRIGPLT